MSSHVVIRLDTHGPRVTRRNVSFARSGQMSVAYALDEPTLVHAELELADGRVLAPAQVTPELVVFRLPDDPGGLATLRARARDDVGNETTGQLLTFIVDAPGAVGILLDTTAPTVTWGAVGGTTAGELLQVAYTLDEPELLDATLELADGRSLTATALPDRLEVLLPADTPDGPARLRARVRDDVGNEAFRELVVAITGVPVAPPESPPAPSRPGWPQPRPRPRRRGQVVHRRSGLRASSRVRLRGSQRVHELVTLAGRSRLVASRHDSTAVAVLSRAAVEQRRVTTIDVTLRSRTAVRRRDGGDDEALLLDLL